MHLNKKQSKDINDISLPILQYVIEHISKPLSHIYILTLSNPSPWVFCWLAWINSSFSSRWLRILCNFKLIVYNVFDLSTLSIVQKDCLAQTSNTIINLIEKLYLPARERFLNHHNLYNRNYEEWRAFPLLVGSVNNDGKAEPIDTSGMYTCLAKRGYKNIQTCQDFRREFIWREHENICWRCQRLSI